MRLVHLGDLHLGAENYGRLDPQTGLSSRLFDFLRCLDTAVDCAIERHADLVVFAGDAYRSREPNPTHQREFAHRIHRLVSAGIPVLLVAGNHDLPSLPAKASSLDVFSALEVPGVTVIRRPQVIDQETKSGVIRCACLPALPRAMLLRDEDRRLDADALRRALSRRLAQVAAGLAEAVGGFSPSILVAHVAVEGAMMGSEVSLISGAEPMVPLEAVADPRYAYVALGHVHRFQEMNAHPPVVYCGSLDRVDFGEEGQEKGFVIVDIERDSAASPNGWRASYEFVPTPARRFLTIDLQVSGADATAQAEQAIGAANTSQAIVRVRVTMNEEQPLDEERLRSSLGAAFAALPISKQVRAAAAPRAPGVAERMTDPLAALGEYLKLRQVSPERARALRAKAEDLLAALRRDGEPVLGAAREAAAGPADSPALKLPPSPELRRTSRGASSESGTTQE
jgi:exonuclease SbcD